MEKIIQKIILYFKEVKVEIKKVNWPTRKQTIKYTTIVLGICISVAIFLGGIDFFFQMGLDKFILR
jgi:preprotein translocase subunit SecE